MCVGGGGRELSFCTVHRLCSSINVFDLEGRSYRFFVKLCYESLHQY